MRCCNTALFGITQKESSLHAPRPPGNANQSTAKAGTTGIRISKGVS